MSINILKTKDRALVGVVHVAGNQTEAISVLDQYKFNRIGLELGPRTELVEGTYFGELASLYRSRGIGIEPVENQRLRDQFEWSYLLRRHDASALQKINLRREDAMIEKIIRGDIRVVVVGVGHSDRMAARLPGYEYIRLARD